MRTIDIHAHLVPQALWRAADTGREWYGFRHEPGQGLGTMVGTNGKRTGFTSPKVRFITDERLKDMDAQGVDVQVVSVHTPFFGHHLDPAQGLALAREVNDEIAGLTRQWPRRFAGLATLPVQDVPAAIAELERAVTVLGLKGAELDTHVNGKQWDDPGFLPLFKAAEAMGAVFFFHPQPQHNFLMDRTPRDGLFNSLGVILDDAIVTAILIAGGPRRRARLLCDGAAGPRLAEPARGPPHPSAAQRLPEAPLLRHRDGQRGGAPLPARPGRRRPRRHGQRLAIRRLGSLARGLGAGPGQPHAGGKGEDPLAEPRGLTEARAVAG
jgi:hypothetical protein